MQVLCTRVIGCLVRVYICIHAHKLGDTQNLADIFKIYFDAGNRLVAMDRSRRTMDFLLSPFAKQLDQVLVYLLRVNFLDSGQIVRQISKLICASISILPQ